MKFTIFQNGAETDFTPFHTHRDKYVECSIDLPTKKGVETVVYKYAAVVSSLNHPVDQLMEHCKEVVKSSAKKGFEQMRLEQAAAWARKWEEADIRIDGDVAAQQGIRFNIFQLYQTYTGEDERLNIGPKGFTGEKYGGSTYWDTEAYCFPFYGHRRPARGPQLLVYRYKHCKKPSKMQKNSASPTAPPCTRW
jgi:maltose phosphorylase